MKKALAFKHYDYLKLLAAANKNSTRNKLIDAGEKEQIYAVIECIYNILDGNVEIPKEHMRRYKNFFKKLMIPPFNILNIQKLLKQDGGFIPLLLPCVLAYLRKLRIMCL